jgi:RNA polymerase sigma factor (TIGR02999 family)
VPLAEVDFRVAGDYFPAHPNSQRITEIGMNDITLMLQAAHSGESLASEELLPLVYDELRKLAAARMARESDGQTLQATALVHEAWLRLAGDEHRTWQNRAHFFAAAADAMRRILIEKARNKSRQKRGGGQQVRADIDIASLAATKSDEHIVLVNDALEQLEHEDPEEARVVVLKFFGGLTNQEVADVLGLSKRTVDRQWAAAKVWLYQQIQRRL